MRIKKNKSFRNISVTHISHISLHFEPNDENPAATNLLLMICLKIKEVDRVVFSNERSR